MLPVKVLSRLFRGKFLAYLKKAFRRGELTFHGRITSLSDPRQFQSLLNNAFATEWVVYAKCPFGGPEHVLHYLARYTHRVAISNHRLVSLNEGEVTFRWKDYAHGHKKRIMKLDAKEFLRRFLLHVLPCGFVRIRHFGFLANRNRAALLGRCCELLTALPPARSRLAEPSLPPRQELTYSCPQCHSGLMRVIERFTTQEIGIQCVGWKDFNDTS